MATHATPKRMTFEEFLAFPSDPNDERRYELVDGVPVVVPSGSGKHQVLILNVAFALRAAADLAGGDLVIQEFLVKVSTYRGAEPDLLFFSAARRAQLQTNYLDGPADIVVEVLSPSTKKKDRVRNLEWYGGLGVPEYWIFDQDRPRVQLYRRPGSGMYAESATLEGPSLLTTPLLPKLAVTIDSLYQYLP